MQTLRRDKTSLHIHDAGPRAGRVVMFANSLGTDLRVWDALLEKVPNDLRIVRYDKRGHGLSDCPPAPYDMNTLTDDAEAVAEALNVRDITFVGLSIGGLIGQGLAARRPDLVKALVLMDTGAKIGTPEMWQDRIDALRADGLEAMADAIMQRWFMPEFRNSEAVAPWRNMVTRTPLEGYIGCSAAIAATDLTGVTPNIRCPVLALVGAGDKATTPDLVEWTAKLCNAEFHVIPNAGHLPCVERPDETAAAILAFLERTAT